MDSVQQDACFRQRVVKCSYEKGTRYAARLHHVSDRSVRRWRRRYDGTTESVKEKSSRPHSSPIQHSPEEDNLVRRVWRKNKKYGLDMLWIKLVQEFGYKRSRTTLFRAMRRMGIYKKAEGKPKRRLSEPYERMSCCGQRVQVDVKYVPAECLAGSLGETKLYQYSAIDEYCSMEFKMIFDEHSAYSSVEFLKGMLRYYPFPIQCIQTDNGTEFTNKFVSDKPGAFDLALEKLDIRHKLIRVATPRHNGRVERSHRTDQRFFYEGRRFFSLVDARAQLAVYLRWCNNRPRLRHGWRSARDVLLDFLAVAA
jgi:hypothetical protein